MKSIIALLLICTFSTNLNAQFNHDNLKIKNDTSSVNRSTLKKLRLYPIYANNHFKEEFENLEKFTSLEKAIVDNEIKLTEINKSGTVNKLLAENTSKKSIYLLAGEVVKGGKQDRVIGQDIIINPGEVKHIDAFCVEQGRWQEKESGIHFDGYMSISSPDVRKAAILNKNQAEVWEKVAEVTTANNANTKTGTYTELENSEHYNTEVNQYMEVFSSIWDSNSDVVGVIAVTADRIIGCDIFATHDLFTNSYNNLLKSYITEAITHGDTVTISNNKVQLYLDAFLADESKQEEVLEKDGAIFKNNGKKVHLSRF